MDVHSIEWNTAKIGRLMAMQETDCLLILRKGRIPAATWNAAAFATLRKSCLAALMEQDVEVGDHPSECQIGGTGHRRKRRRAGSRRAHGSMWWLERDGVFPPDWVTPHDCYAAVGAGGHHCRVVPERDMVIVHRMNTDIK